MTRRVAALAGVVLGILAAGDAHAQVERNGLRLREPDRTIPPPRPFTYRVLRLLDGTPVSELMENIDTNLLVRTEVPEYVRNAGCSFYPGMVSTRKRTHVPVEMYAGTYPVRTHDMQSAKITIYSTYVDRVRGILEDNISLVACYQGRSFSCSLMAFDRPEMGGRKVAFHAMDGSVNLERLDGWDNAIASFVVSCALFSQ